MQTKWSTRISALLARLIFIILPVVLLVYYLLQYWTGLILANQATVYLQTSYFAFGAMIALVFYAIGFRFWPTYILLILGLYFLYRGIDATAFGEFETFFIAVQFLVFAVLFSAGWLVGYMSLRFSKGITILAIGLLLLGITSIAQNEAWLQHYNSDNAFIEVFLMQVAPLFFGTVFLLYANVVLQAVTESGVRYWSTILKKMGVFAVVLLLIIGGLTWVNKPEIIAQMKDFGGGAKQGESNMLKKKERLDPDGKPSAGNAGGFTSNDQLKMSGSNSKENVLLFAAHIDNFFDDGETPNPVYLTTFAYGKFDTLTETLERDTLAPFSDWFSPDLTQIPMYHTLVDSSVLQFGIKDEYRKTVEIEVYNKNMDNGFFFGPTIAFFAQPIAVDPSFSGEFKSAFRAKSNISQLNSAYFVYNSDNPDVRRFQEMRFDVLRQVQNFDKLDSTFYAYYTDFPKSATYTSVAELAQKITKNKALPVDKVLAIRDFFLARDDNGKKIFRYSDNPGVPDLPSASRLTHFLFASKKGYCAYYATATLYMLRSLGIPSRVVGGFLTEDRSSGKNKGWYWYYADQAHAWVQVYFPGIGWIDFDTTIDNDDARESPQADGTPPLQPPKAFFAANGVMVDVDTLRKMGQFQLAKVVYHDKEYEQNTSTTITLDLSVATIRRDTLQLSLKDIMVGDTVTVVSFAQVLENKKVAKGASFMQVIAALPAPLPTDQVYLYNKAKEVPTAVTETTTPSSNKWIFVLMGCGIVVVLILSLPYAKYLFYKRNFRATPNQTLKLYWANALWKYYAQVHYPSFKAVSELHLAQTIDKAMHTNLQEVVTAYHASKYGQKVLDKVQLQKLEQVLFASIEQLQKPMKPMARLTHWLNLSNVV